MAIFSFYNPSGSSYFTAETVRNGSEVYDSSSNQSAVGTYSSFVNLNRDHLVTSSYIFSIPVPNGTGSFTFDPAYSVFGTSSVYIRGTGEFTAIISTYSGSFTLTPAQMYGAGILNTFALTPIPAFQARVAADSGSYEAFECQNNIFANTPVNILQTASLLLTPNAGKTSKLYSILPENGNGDFTVTRATTATRVNSAGLVELVPYNLLTFSEMFTDASWVKSQVAITANTITAPNGTLTADKFIANATSTTHQISQTTDSNSYGFSIYAKAGEETTFSMWVANASRRAEFNLALGTITLSTVTSSSITDVGNGWYRCFIYDSLPTTTYRIYGRNGGVYLGNNVDGFYIWGAQANEGTSALTYQPTTTRLNIPRLDYSLGSCPNLLLEPQRTNLCLSSNSIGGTSWGAAYGGVGLVPTITLNYATAPDGTTSASRLQLSLGGGTTTTDQSLVTQTLTATSTRGSFYIKTTDGSTQTIYMRGASATNIVVTGTWTRYDFDAGTLTGTQFGLGLRGGQTPINSNTVDILVWGAQLEVGAYATSYIPTTSASVTRNVDNLSLSNVFSNGLITASGGTWFLEIKNNISLIRDAFSTSINLGDGTTNAIGIGHVTGAVSQRLSVRKFLSSVGTPLYTTLTDTIKVAIKWNGTTADVFVNGVKVVSATAFAITNLPTLSVTSSDVPKIINQMALFPTPLTDTQCTQLTTL